MKTWTASTTPDPRACTDCGATSIVSFKSLDDKPRCARCHIAAVEKKRREASR
jgi:hypothetical protein